MAVYFISDIHLSDANPELTALFEHFIKNILKSNDILYIAGDLFEYWIGDDQNSWMVQKTIALLSGLEKRHILWYFLAGNRDLLIGKKFLQQTHGVLLPEKFVILLGDTPVLLMHGDTLCTKDHRYQAWRVRAHQQWLQTVFLLMPRFFRQHLMNRARAKSLLKKEAPPAFYMDVAEDTVQKEFQIFQVNVMIHGHVHRPAVHLYSSESIEKKIRYVLADWNTHGNYLKYEQGDFVLSYFTCEC